jgi:putative PIN family toxin of toxin-antitoxin system
LQYPAPVRLVLDTSVLVAAFRSLNGGSRRLIDASDAGEFTILISQPLFLEYETVLKRPEQMAAHGFLFPEIDDFLFNLAERAIQVAFHKRIRPQLRDPNDDHVLETAVNGEADAIVTHNVSDFLPETRKFNIQVLTPGDIIRMRLKR